MQISLIPITQDKSKMAKYLIHPFSQEIYSVYEKLYLVIGYEEPWVGYFALLENQVVGLVGFKGLPKLNTIEIAYGMNPEKENQDIATSICAELIAIARCEKPRVTISARTLREHSASAPS